MHVQLHSTSDKFSSGIAGILSGKLGIFGHTRELAEVTDSVVSWIRNSQIRITSSSSSTSSGWIWQPNSAQLWKEVHRNRNSKGKETFHIYLEINAWNDLDNTRWSYVLQPLDMLASRENDHSSFWKGSWKTYVSKHAV